MHDPARMKNSRSSIVQIVQLLRFASLMLLLGSVASASAQTVRERLEKDTGFRVYPVVFGVTGTSKPIPPAVQLVEVGTIKGRRKMIMSRIHSLKQRRRRSRQSLQNLK